MIILIIYSSRYFLRTASACTDYFSQTESRLAYRNAFPKHKINTYLPTDLGSNCPRFSTLPRDGDYIHEAFIRPFDLTGIKDYMRVIGFDVIYVIYVIYVSYVSYVSYVFYVIYVSYVFYVFFIFSYDTYATSKT